MVRFRPFIAQASATLRAGTYYLDCQGEGPGSPGKTDSNATRTRRGKVDTPRLGHPVAHLEHLRRAAPRRAKASPRACEGKREKSRFRTSACATLLRRSSPCYATAEGASHLHYLIFSTTYYSRFRPGQRATTDRSEPVEIAGSPLQLQQRQHSPCLLPQHRRGPEQSSSQWIAANDIDPPSSLICSSDLEKLPILA